MKFYNKFKLFKMKNKLKTYLMWQKYYWMSNKFVLSICLKKKRKIMIKNNFILIMN